MVSAACEQEKIERTDYRFSRRDVRTFTGYGLLRTPRTDPDGRISRIRLLPQVVTRRRRGG